jgi:sorbitol-specific phosphotransferase system component IIBC
MAFWDKVKKTLVGDTPAPEPKKAPAGPAEVSSAAGAASPAGADGDIEGFNAVKVEHGLRGWGGPLVIQPTKQRNLVYSVTGGGIHPVAQKIADLTGAQPFDGFKSKADFEQIAVAVIDCGGTARVGVYPMKGIPTIDVHAATPSGPLAKYITETNFVSGVKVEHVTQA